MKPRPEEPAVEAAVMRALSRPANPRIPGQLEVYGYAIAAAKFIAECEGTCFAREDATHCEHWWDGGPDGAELGGPGCCTCGFIDRLKGHRS
jgi:hypothetical protein